MDTPPCNATVCSMPTIEDRPITRDRGMPNWDFMMVGRVSTMDDCFSDMEKVTYGTRVLAKVVDDKSCDEPEYKSICQTLIEQNRTVIQDTCQSIG